VWMMAAALSAMALVGPAVGQQLSGQPDARSFFTGVDPRQVKNVKVDTSKAMRRTNLTQALQPNVTQRSTKVTGLGSYFPRMTLGSWPPKVPQFMTVKTPTQKPPTTFPKGVNLFDPPKK
jgi:hypothetical protein